MRLRCRRHDTKGLGRCSSVEPRHPQIYLPSSDTNQTLWGLMTLRFMLPRSIFGMQ